MDNCKFCHKSPEWCNCYRNLDRYHCALCTVETSRSNLEIVDSSTGFVDHIRCKDHKACMERCSKLDWGKIS